MIKIILPLFISSFSLATTSPVYDMQLRIKIKDQVVTPRIIARAGQKATMIEGQDGQDKIFVEATADESDKNAVMMNFTVGTIDKLGKKTVLSTPKILTMENEAAAIVQGDQSDDKISLGVVVSRQ